MFRNINKIKVLYNDISSKRHFSHCILFSKENYIRGTKSTWKHEHLAGFHASFPHASINNELLQKEKSLDINEGCTNYKKSTYTVRSNTCGELNLKNIGEKVTLYGWLEYQRMSKFLTLRDGYGATQIIIPSSKQKEASSLEKVPYESILKVVGIVQARPKDMINPKQQTGEIEVLMESVEVINSVCEKLPFDIRSFNKAKEHIRLQHRYLDLRFPEMQDIFRLRSEMLLNMRKYLIEKHFFVEVETPTLFSRTPGGAQEFIVPTRNIGEFYSLVQSPQQFKQLLMAGAIDRYFQFARCYRDEGARPDRQPEFTQLDIELSYPQKNGILELIENLLYYSWPKTKGTIRIPFHRMSYDEAMCRYGSDKPDIRFGLELTDITENISANASFNKNYNKFGCYMIRVPNSFAILPKSIKNVLSEFSKKYPDVKFIQSTVNSSGITDWCNSKLVNVFGEGTLKQIAYEQQLQPNDVVLITFGNQIRAQTLLGKIRILYKEQLESLKIFVPTTVDEKWNFLWITDFPLFTMGSDKKNENNEILTSTHHPFTAPHPEDIEKMQIDPLNVRSQAYDLVLNGSEIGGGSIRIHDAELQKKILSEYLKIDFSHLHHLIKALGSGCPPHGGIALGIDRLIAIICDTVSIRDVIAFPKSVDGRDPLSGAPVPISEEEKTLYHIQSISKPVNILNINEKNVNIAKNK